MSIYSLITYPSMIMIGRIGDLIGHKQAVVASCAMFALGSIGVALSPSVWMIIFFRAVQAIGGGGLPTSCMSLVGVLFPKNRHKMMGFAVKDVDGEMTLSEEKIPEEWWPDFENVPYEKRYIRRFPYHVGGKQVEGIEG